MLGGLLSIDEMNQGLAELFEIIFSYVGCCCTFSNDVKIKDIRNDQITSNTDWNDFFI